jgi:ABC-type multidrug transport system fused ATPase/permease subunit
MIIHNCLVVTSVIIISLLHFQKLDNVDIKGLNIEWMRSNISVVSQEPVLFDVTIRENIAYGVLTDVADQHIFDAAKLANIHDFIVSLPEVGRYAAFRHF